MLLSELKSIFNKTLVTIYPSKERDSIFYITVEYLLKYSKIDIHQNLNKSIPPEIEKKFLEIISRLKKCEPIQYITEFAEFYGLKLFVDRRVLIPRQETEMLVDIVIKESTGKNNGKILDLCTGSGCIAIALSVNLPEWQVTASDISNDSLEVAKKNAEQNRCNIQFIRDNVLQPLEEFEVYDCIVSNPPYVRKSEKKFMHKNVLDFEPPAALFVEDDDPLIFYRSIASFAINHLTPGGKIYLEINEFLGTETKEFFEKSGFCEVQTVQDIQNKIRFLKAQK